MFKRVSVSLRFAAGVKPQQRPERCGEDVWSSDELQSGDNYLSLSTRLAPHALILSSANRRIQAAQAVVYHISRFHTEAR